MEEISPEKWREASIHGIKLAQVIIEKSDRAVTNGRLTDPLPLLRDACIKQSNDRMRSYMRATRNVVVQLRKSFAAVNEEMKSTNRCKESLEKALEHKRKDLALNLESQELRAYRPVREKEPPDYANKLLVSEHSHLVSLKRSLEAQLRKVQLQLDELNMVRSRLGAVIQERSRVTDLLCQAISFDQGQQTPREAKRKVSGISLRRSPRMYPSQPENEELMEDRPLTRSLVTGSRPWTRSSVLDSRPLTRGSPVDSLLLMRGSSRQKAYSAPVPLELGEDLGVEPEASDVDPAGPYSAVSVEAMQTMMLASEAILRSKEMRREVASAVDHAQRLQQAAHESVNENLIKKIAQTITVTDHLGFNSGETKLAKHRTQRHYNTQQRTLGYLLGPMSAGDVTTRERMDRPFVKVYQRHMGTDLPEAAHLIQATEIYQNSMDSTMKNMALLKLAHKSIKADIKDKKKAAFLDSDVIRLRRRKANHRWVLQGKSYLPKPQEAAVRSLSH